MIPIVNQKSRFTRDKPEFDIATIHHLSPIKQSPPSVPNRLPLQNMPYEPVLRPEAVLEGSETERQLGHGRRSPQATSREYLSVMTYLSLIHQMIHVMAHFAPLFCTCTACRRNREEAERLGEQEAARLDRLLWQRRSGKYIWLVFPPPPPPTFFTSLSREQVYM